MFRIWVSGQPKIVPHLSELAKHLSNNIARVYVLYTTTQMPISQIPSWYSC